MARRKRFEHLRKAPRQRLDRRKVDAGRYGVEGCIAPKNRSICRTWNVRPRLQSMAAISSARGPVTCIPKKAGLIGWLHRPHGCALRPLLAQTICCCASDMQRTRAWHGQADAFCALFSAPGERIPVERCFFRAVSSFAYWRRAAVALHFALPTGSADPTPPTNTEHITHGKNRR